jgi:hypothetical protein
MSHTSAEFDPFRRALRAGDATQLKKLMGDKQLPLSGIDKFPYLWADWKPFLPHVRCLLALWSDLSVEVTQEKDKCSVIEVCKGMLERNSMMTVDDREHWTATLELLEKFKADPRGTQRRLRVELGFTLDPNATCEPCTCTATLCCPGFGCQEGSKEEPCDHWNCDCGRPCCT